MTVHESGTRVPDYKKDPNEHSYCYRINPSFGTSQYLCYLRNSLLETFRPTIDTGV
jgi:hypothetical protein